MSVLSMEMDFDLKWLYTGTRDGTKNVKRVAYGVRGATRD